MRKARSQWLRPRMGQDLELVTESEIIHDLAVGVNVRAPEIIEKTAALADHLQKSSSAVVVLHMNSEVFSEEVDPLGERRHLDPRGPCVRRMRPILIEAR
jgi:hypothetical protein